MAVELPTAATQPLSAAGAALQSDAETSLDERWAAWRARVAEHDRAVRRKVRIAVPILAIAAAIVLALLVR